jgi:hypothetical protein
LTQTPKLLETIRAFAVLEDAQQMLKAGAAANPQHQRKQSIMAHARQELDRLNGSITDVPNGTLRLGAFEWAINSPWYGPEQTYYVVRESLWSKTIIITFEPGAGDSKDPLLFTLHLKPPLPLDDVHLAADTYMMLINLTRTTV